MYWRAGKWIALLIGSVATVVSAARPEPAGACEPCLDAYVVELALDEVAFSGQPGDEEAELERLGWMRIVVDDGNQTAQLEMTGASVDLGAK